jgi:hypothetical protein
MPPTAVDYNGDSKRTCGNGGWIGKRPIERLECVEGHSAPGWEQTKPREST